MNLHGIEHHSPSSLNSASMSLALYFLERVMVRKSLEKRNMTRGKAAEAGIVHGLVNPSVSLTACQDLALAAYDAGRATVAPAPRTTGAFGVPLPPALPQAEGDKERDGVPGIVEQGIAALRKYGIPDMVQAYVYHRIPGVTLPILGYLDLGYSQHGLVVDIKSQLQLSSSPSEPHKRQVAFYCHNTNSSGEMCYVTPKRSGLYPLTDMPKDMHSLVCTAQRVERFLSLSKDPMELAALLIPDYSHFVFNDPLVRAYAKEIFGY